jgi:GNAT superfamily N-acetyltransferase
MSGPPALAIRVAAASDREALRALLEAQLREHEIPIESAALERAIDGVLERPERGRMLLAEQGGRAIGVATLSFVWTLEHGGRAAWLEELYVAPERRGRGTGSALLEAAIAAAADAGALAVDLEVEESHARAGGLYLRHGFRAHTRRRFVRALAPPASSPVARSAPGPLPLHGGCLCGAIRYRVLHAPIEVSHCHCGVCRRSTGAAFVTWATFPARAFGFVVGSPAERRSSPHAVRTFCAACGTALTFREDARPSLLDVTVGSLDAPELAAPERHIWVSSAVRWVALDDELPRCSENAPLERGS